MIYVKYPSLSIILRWVLYRKIKNGRAQGRAIYQREILSMHMFNLLGHHFLYTVWQWTQYLFGYNWPN